MQIYCLGAVLIELHISLLNDTFDEDVETRNGKVVLADSKEALKYAEIVMDGDIELNNIELCKVESQQECLFGTLRIPRLSDIHGSKYKIEFFVNKNNIVIIDDTSFSYKLIKRIQASKTKQGQTRERFLYNYLTGIISRDLGYISSKSFESAK